MLDWPEGALQSIGQGDKEDLGVGERRREKRGDEANDTLQKEKMDSTIRDNRSPTLRLKYHRRSAAYDHEAQSNF